jgi:hypothetical protein
MKAIRRGIFIIALIGFSVSSGYCQGGTTRTMTVSFDNPGRPGIVKIVSGEGDVTVTGYPGKDVRIKAMGSNKNTLPPEDDPKAKGLRRISGSGFNVSTEANENAVVITRPLGDKVELEIQVPSNTALKIGSGGNDLRSTITIHSKVSPPAPSPPLPSGEILDIQNIVVNGMKYAFGFPGGVFEGNITVENVSGNMEISTLDGDITLKNISGTTVANSMDGNITVVFRTITENRPMAFSTIDGDIDITFPERIKADITAKNVDGSIYTDFDMEVIPGSVQKIEKVKTVPESLFGMMGNTVRGKINGGGMDIQIKTVDGSIYIRKAK